MEHVHNRFGNRNMIERFFRELKYRTNRFYNNVNTKTAKSMVEIATIIARIHNLALKLGEGDCNT